jgi:hypothetical protein
MAVPKGHQFKDRQTFSDEQLIDEIPKLGVRGFAKKYGADMANVNRRRRKAEMRHGTVIQTPMDAGGRPRDIVQYGALDKHPAAINLGIENGIILIGSDAHYWPGVVSAAHRAFLEFCREYNPKVVFMNGDAADFPTISRFAPIGWEKRPSIVDEIDNLKAMLSEIEKVSKGARHIMPLGNHDGRFSTRLASVAPEYAKINGVHLKDHIPNWEPCWASFINKDIVVKHRIKGGIHAPRNNTLAAGLTTFTGHLHSLKVHPHNDYRGIRYGVDCGMMADPYGPQFFNYVELGPLDWRSGFILATITKGVLMWPEVVYISGKDTVQFRGKEWVI